MILGGASWGSIHATQGKTKKEVVEEILDIKIFSTMNLILKQKIKTILEDIRDIEHQYDLVSSKIDMQESHIVSMKENKDKIIQQKQDAIKENDFELSKRRSGRKRP